MRRPSTVFIKVVSCLALMFPLSMFPLSMFPLSMLPVSMSSAALAADSAYHRAAREVRQKLPEGWRLSVTDHHWIVRREKPVTVYNAVNLPGFDSEAEFREFVGSGLKKDYLIILRFGPKITSMKYETYQRHNREVDRQREELARGLRGMTRKFDQYLPSNAEERERLAQYKAAVAKLRRRQLPDYCYDGYSIYVEDTRSWSQAFLEDEEAAECARVRKIVTGPFQPYENESQAESP